MTGEALFVPEGDTWVPTDYSRGPWNPDALHGGPVAALATRAAESCDAPSPMRLARLTLELMRPVPVAPLEVSARISRPGRKVQLVDVTISSGGLELAWARALRIRVLDHDDDSYGQLAESAALHAKRAPKAPPGPETGHHSGPLVEGYRGFHNSGAELQFVRGEFDSRGPSAVWVRLAVPVVPEEEPSPSQRVAAAADFGNGVSSVLDFSKWTFINPDLNVFLERPPVGEWVCLDAATQLGVPGSGLSQCLLWDEQGPIGRSLQSLLVQPR